MNKKPKILKPAKRGNIDPKLIRLAVKEVSENRPYAKEAELSGRIVNLIHEYDDELSLVAVIGILDVVKDEIKEDS